MNTELERNLWMAEKLHHHADAVTDNKDCTARIAIGTSHYSSSIPIVFTFSLENSAEDREAAVIWLGEEQGISIRNPAGKWYFWHEDWFGDRKSINDDCQFFDTYKDALFAAIDHMMKLPDSE